jgi:hypothetical protein
MLEIIRGDSARLSATVYTDETRAARQDLSTAEAIRFTGRRGTPAGDVVFERTLSDGHITITDAAEGEVEIQLAPSDTSALPSVETRLSYDLEITFAGGQVRTVALASLSVLPDISR